MQTISNKQTCVLSRFYDGLIRRNLQWLTADCYYHFLLVGVSELSLTPHPTQYRSFRRRNLLVEGVRHDGGQDQYCAVFVSRGGRFQVTVSFHLPPLQPSTVSWIIKQHACMRTHGRRVTGHLNALWSSCVMRSVNNWWTCSDARNIGRYNNSQYVSIRYTQYRFRYWVYRNRPFYTKYITSIASPQSTALVTYSKN